MQNFVLKLAKSPPKNDEALESAKRLFLRANPGFRAGISKKSLLALYHKLRAKNKVKQNLTLEKLLTKRAVRTLSGVAIVTVLTRPFHCPGQCVYCPDEKGMPKSYLSDEPAAARAKLLRFDPYEQVRQRVLALKQHGHTTDKIELIVKGGTWNAYPVDYQYWFTLRCFQGANGSNTSIFSLYKNVPHFFAIVKARLAIEQKKNERATHRVVGLTLETRPDFVTEKNLAIMRELGCTRVELGAQSTDDKILKKIKRGHDVATIKNATRFLKNLGFKVDYHFMPQLPGATAAKDLKMMNELFSDSDFRPDMLKIYPCTVVKNSELYDWLVAGKYKPYSDKKLIDALIKFKTDVPRYVRISRLIRDIPGHHIQAGNKVTNLRQVIQAEMNRRGLKCNCLRCREAGHQPENLSAPKLFIEKYTASGGTEYFLSYEDKKRIVVFAFCRLRITPGSAFVRELHTYGHLVGIGQNEKNASQHTGLGKKLLAVAENICKKCKVKKLSVISGVGVRDYYRKLGYTLEMTYMVKNLRK